MTHYYKTLKQSIFFCFLMLLTTTLAAQTTTIQKTTVSGCYYYSNASKTTISVQVGWTGANSSDIITVRVDNNVVTQRIINVEDMYNPGTGSNVAGPIKSPQVVAFEIDADGNAHTITAVMSGAHSSSATPVNVNAPSPCTPMACSSGDVGGMVFNDNNSDGIKQGGESVGIPGVTVTAFDINGNQYVATSDALGNYAFSSANSNLIPPTAYPVRLEFTNFPSFVFGNAGPSISGNRSSVRFLDAPTCGINCGAVNPINYSQANPVMVTNLYTNNNPLGGGNAGTTASLIAHSYTNETNFNYTTLAQSSLIGSVWGKTWNKFKKKMIVSAFLKRHCGLGPLGLGGLYMVNYSNPASPVFSNFLDVTTIGIDVGQSVIPSNILRGMGATKTNQNIDAQSFQYIGKAGIGNMDLSDDGNTLYLMNLYDKKVYTIDLTNYFANGILPTASDVSSITIPDPGCANGSFRPFALTIRDGLMYVGMVCDASTGNTSSLEAFVKSYNLTTTAWSDVFSFPLTYPKGYPDQQDGSKTGWYIWSDNPSVVNPGNSSAILHPVPILSDIEFDMDGTMVIALMDRTSHQYGQENADSWNGSTWSNSTFFIAAGGDVLRAFYSNGAYVLENAAKAGPSVGYAPTNNQGPGFGEFYNDNIGGGVNYHSEMGTGGLALRPGSGEIIAGMVDPSFYKGDGVLWANGIRKMSNTTGQPTGGKSYYSDDGISQFGKANGMGDIELVTDNVAYIEIGNYIWKDLDLDGVQDPNERGMSGVVLNLYNAVTGSLVATKTTDATGNYYFSTLNGDTLKTNTSYKLLIGSSQFNSSDSSIVLSSVKHKITSTTSGQGSNAMLNDNNFSANNLSTALGAMPAGLPFIDITTGDAGFVNHSFDLGMYALPGLGDTVWNDVNKDGIQNIGEPAIANLNIYLLDSLGARIDSTNSNSSGYYKFINLQANVNYQVEFSLPGATYATTLPNVGTNDSTDSDIDAFLKTQQVILSFNEFNNTLDAGFFQCTKPDAGIDLTACVNSCIDIIGTNPSNGLWTAHPSNATGATLGATNSGIANVCFDNTVSGTYSFIYSSGLCSDTMSISINSLPTADAGSTQNLDCITTSATIGTSAIGGNTYDWSPATGLSATNIAQPTANPSATTTYTVTVTGSNGCTATSTVDVNVNTTPPTADAGSTQNLDCTTTSATIGTTAIGGNSYDWSPATGLSATNIAQPTANPSATTTYTVTVTGANGCTSTSTVTVNVNTTSPTADAGSTQNLDCTTTSATIGTSAIVGNSYDWSPATGVNVTNIAQPTANPSTTTTYTVTVTGSNGCTATSTVDVNVNTAPPTADAGSTQNLDCTTTSASIGTSAIGGNSYDWSPATGLSATNIAQPTANPSATTTYTVTVTGSNGCTATSTITVNVNTTPPTPTITGTTIVCNGSTTTITAIGAVSYVWSNAAITDTTSVGEGTYTVTATASNGCTSTTSVLIENKQGSIGNYVWYDANGNGLNDEATTSGINGLTVELWKETSNGSNVYALDQTTTTANDLSSNPGYYTFAICESANYKVKFPLVSGGQGLTEQTTTTATDNNNDANPTDGYSPAFAIDVNGVGVAKDNNTIDAGYYKPAQLGNYVWNDIDQDGAQDANEVGVAGITVTLYNNSNVVVSNTITDAYGYYKFAPLDPGTYYVSFTLPANYVFTLQDAAGNDDTDNDVNPITGITGNYVLVAADSNMSVDAGIYFVQPVSASVGNYVWLDVNQDGIQDAGEEGISGVTVTLYNNLGNPVATMLTDANGFYLFTNVVPGTYTVGFTPKAGLAISPNNGLVSNPSNSDANALTGVTGSFTVNAGDEITYVDAGMYPIAINFPLLGGLGDKVWYDVDQDGVQDANETGVSGITVTLYQNDGVTVISTTTTNAFGDYIFNGLAQGQYVVGFSNLPLGYVLTTTTGTDSTTNSDANVGTGKTPVINLAAGQYNLTYDAGIYNTNVNNNNSIGDKVWDDINKNGIQDPSESGVSGVTVTLYDNTNTPIAVTSTDMNGMYLFPNLPNGTYYVGFSNLPVGYVFSPAGQGTAATDSDPSTETGLTSSVTLTGGTNITDLDAGINLGNTRIGLATLGDLVWYDINNNGLQDPTESGVAGVTVTLYQQDGITVIKTTTTDALGNYIFTDLNAGSYVVGFTNLPVGFTISPKNSDSQGLNGELNSDVNIGTQKTDVITLGTGEDKMSVDMGITPPAGTASLGNFVWFDLNNDGLQTSGEPGVQGVSVSLLNSTGDVVATTTTDANGEYYFIGLTPGTYSVNFSNLPNGYTLTTENADANGINGTANSDANVVTGQTAQVTLAINDNNLNLDAGIISTTVASVGDYVWFDADQDGIQDPNESGIGGVLVTLYDNTNTPVASAITRPDGGYIFTNVIPGTYTIGFSNTPIGMVFTQEVGTPTDNDNSNVNPATGLTASFTVLAGTHNPTIDAGLTTPLLAGLGNYVWYDVNENGFQDASEPGVAGVQVTLYASNGTTVLATAVTDGNGAYSFTNLGAETYIVGFSNLPAGFTPTRSLGLLNDALNSDMGVNGKTSDVVLAAGEYNPNIDAGIYFGVPLPSRELTATIAIIQAGNVCEVNWYTKEEMNTKNFEIERSIDGSTFAKVGTTLASVNTTDRTNYIFNDNIELVKDVAVIYYRIKLIDIDGKSSYSNTINVRPSVLNGETVIVYPTPFTDKLMIDYISSEVTDLEIELTDVSGKSILKKTQTLSEGMNHIVVSELYSLSSANYFIRIKDLNTGEIFIRKVVK